LRSFAVKIVLKRKGAVGGGALNGELRMLNSEAVGEGANRDMRGRVCSPKAMGFRRRGRPVAAFMFRLPAFQVPSFFSARNFDFFSLFCRFLFTPGS